MRWGSACGPCLLCGMLRGVQKRHRRPYSGLMQTIGPPRSLASSSVHYHDKTMTAEMSLCVRLLPCPEPRRPISDISGQEILFLDWNIACVVSEGIDGCQS